ncbi:MAG: ABC transporter permease [Acholeplasmataceae bacterium]
MKRRLMTVSAIFTIFIFFLITERIIAEPLVFPSLDRILQALLDIGGETDALLSLATSLLRLFLVIAISGFSAILLGYLASQHEWLEYYLTPFVTILRTIPVLSVIVVILIVFGFRLAPYIITFLMVFPLFFQGTLDGIKAIDRTYLDIYHLDQQSAISGIRYVFYPLTKDRILTTFLQSAGLGIKVLVMAEYLAQTPRSIGNAIYLARINLRYDEVFAYTLILILLAVAIESLVRTYRREA